jgi:O-antigen biosynthesis protein WbqP
MKRLMDILICTALTVVGMLPLVVIGTIVRTSSPGPALYWSRRIGRENHEFLMPKFRTMRVDTPQLATHLLDNPDQYLTPIGKFLRKTSLDELPQLYSVLKGDMSLVGPRPALFNQHDLVELRTKQDIHHLSPGVTGWAQVCGRDDLSIEKKVSFDHDYLLNRSIFLDMKILFLTVRNVFRKEGIHH